MARQTDPTPPTDETVDLATLTPDPRNARRHPDRNLATLEASLREVGAARSIVVDETGTVLAGNATVEAAGRMGLTRVRVVDADGSELVAVRRVGLSEEQKRRLALLDNRTAELAEWDADVLASLAEDTDLSGLWDDDELAGLLARLMDGRLADLVWTDPPYGVAYVGKTPDALTLANDDLDDGAYLAFLTDAFTAMLAATKPGGAVYACHADTKGLLVRQAFTQAGWRPAQVLVWVKQHLVLGRQDYQWRHEPVLYGWKPGAVHHFADDRTQTTVLEVDRPSRSAEHPTTKPVELVATMVRNSSRTGDLVLDPFAGSGTTLVACEQLGRVARLVELDPRYCDVVVARWEQLTGKAAERVPASDDAEPRDERGEAA